MWNWKERAAAYDLAEQEKRAKQMYAMAIGVPHASKAYRIIRLDYLARLIMDQIKPGIELKWCLNAIATYRSIMHDIEREMGEIDEATMKACDAAALEAIKQELTEGKKKR